MSTIETRVVEIKIDNDKFLKGVKTTLDTLDSLNKALQLEGAAKGMRGIGEAAKGFSLSNIADNVDAIADKFSVLGAIGFTVIQNLTNTILDFAKNTVRKLFEPITSGGMKRALNIEQAMFQFQGLGMDVEATMDSALEAVLGTAFGLDEAAVAAAMFGASGVQAGDDMTHALRGISGVAAMAGSSYSDIANVFTKVAGQGRLMGDDLNRLGTRGINAAATLAEAFGITEHEVRQLVTQGQISFEMFSRAMSDAFGEHATKANETYTGALSNMRAALARLGAAVAGPMNESRRKAILAFTRVIDESHDALKPFIELINSQMEKASARTVKFLDALDFSGPTKTMPVLAEAAKNLLDALKLITSPIGAAFSQIFPTMTAERFHEFALTIRDFTESLKIGGETADRLRRIFAGFFAIFGIGWEITKQLVRTIFELFGALPSGSGSFLELVARLGDWLVAVHAAVKDGTALTKFFNGLIAVLKAPIRLFHWLADAIRNFFDWLPTLVQSVAEMDFSGLDHIAKRLTPFAGLGERMGRAWKAVGSIFRGIYEFLDPFVQRLGEAASKIGPVLLDGLRNIDYSTVLDTVNTGLFAALVLGIRKFLKEGFKFDFSLFGFDNEATGIIGSFRRAFDELTGSLRAMQTKLKAEALLKIAIAVAVLTVSVIALSLIDSARLTASMAALGAMFAQLIVSYLAFEKFITFGAVYKLPLLAAGLILLAIAAIFLSSAVRILANLDWGGLVRGLAGLAGVLTAMVVAAKKMPNPAGLISTGIGMIFLAIGVKILASAVKDISDLSWEEIAKGLIGVGGLLGALALFTQLSKVGKTGVLQGAGIILLAAGIKILASAMGDFSGMSWGEIARGLVALAGALVVMALGLALIPPTAALQATGVLILALSLGMVANALETMGSMSWDEIGKGLTALLGALTLIAAALYVIPPTAALGALGVLLVAMSLNKIGKFLHEMSQFSWEEIGKAMTVLAGSLTVISAALLLMSGAVPGALALIVVTGALAMLAPVLLLFGKMSWEEIGKGLLMLAGVFAVIGVAGLVLAPVVPVIFALGVAVAFLGAGVLLAGAGVFLFAAGLTALAIAGSAGAAALVVIVSAMIGLIPMVMEQIGHGVVAFAKVIATAGPAIFEAITVVIGAMIDAIDELAPKIIKTLIKLIVLMAEEMESAVPALYRSGLIMLLGILEGIRDNIGDIVTVAGELIEEFLRGLGEASPGIIDAGYEMIIDFIEGLTKAIDKNADKMGEAGGELAVAIVRGMIRGLRSSNRIIADAAGEAARSALASARNVLGISSPSMEFIKIGQHIDEGLAIGLRKHSGLVERSARFVATDTLDAMRVSLSRVSDVVSDKVNLTPTIVPVLDLTDVEKEARNIGSLLRANPIEFAASHSAAAEARDIRSRIEDEFDDDDPPTGDTYNFTQNNTSPKALSAAEIYRQTKNQLSTAKGGLPN